MVTFVEDSRVWVEQIEARGVFADARLNERLAKILSIFDADPTGSIPNACEQWAPTKGTYRFFSNKRVSPESLIRPVADVTAQQCAGRKRIYVVHDTTSLNFSRATRADDLGPINDMPNLRGMLAHSSLAVTADGVPVNLLAQHSWCRLVGKKVAKERKKRPYEDKESSRWVQGIQQSHDAIDRNLPESSRPELVHILDSEGDIYDVFALLNRLNSGAIIRSGQVRKVADSTVTSHLAVGQSSLRQRRRMKIPRSHGKPERWITAELRWRPMRFLPPRSGLPEINATMIEVREVDAPEGAKPIHWIVWTNLPVKSRKQAWEIIQTYRFRWRIEEMHLVLKSGCRIEELQLHKRQRLQNAVATYSAIAARIVRMRDLARREPHAPCTCSLSDDEWRVLWTRIHKAPPAADTPAPTIYQATRWIGRLGGHLGRKNDGEPGVRTLWRGYAKLCLLVGGYQACQMSR